MSTVAEDVRQIRRAVYGRDVREAIADGIEHCYSDVSSGVTTANTAANAANVAAQRANTAAAGAEGIPGTASLEDVNNLKASFGKVIVTRKDKENNRENLLTGVTFSNKHIGEDGADSDSAYGVRTNEYIPIPNTHGNTVYYAWDKAEPILVKLFWYTENKTFISAISYTYTANQVPFTDDHWGKAVPQNAKYVRVLLENSTWDLKVNDIAEFISHFSLYYKIENNEPVPEIAYLSQTSIREVNNDYRPQLATTRVSTDFFPVGKGTIIKTPPQEINGSINAKMSPFWYDSELNVEGYTDNWVDEVSFDHDCFVRLTLRKNNTDTVEGATFNEIKKYVHFFHYYAPTDLKYSQEALNGKITADTMDSLSGTDIIKHQLWEYGYISAEGENSLNDGIIRMRNSVNIQRFDKITIDFTEFATGIYGRYLFFAEDGSVILAQGISNLTGRHIISVPNGAHHFRIAICKGWNSAGALLIQDGKKLKIYGERAEGNAIKSYYTEPINTAVSKYIRKSEKDRLGYIWMSDIHLRSDKSDYTYGIFANMIAALRKAAEQANLDFIVLGGDIIDGEANQENIYTMLSRAFKPLSGCSVPVIWLLGNHDDNAYNAVLSKELAINIFPGNSRFHNDIQYQENGYFYFDIPMKHKRVVCFNSSDYPSGKSGKNWWSLSQAQIEWLCANALDTEYDIVILSHICPVYKYSFWNLGNEGGYHTDLMNVISAYNQKRTISLYGVSHNFSRQANNKIVMMHTGHWHWENNPDYLDIRAGGIPCIITGCAKQWDQELEEGETPVNEALCVYTFNEQKATEWHANSFGYNYTHWHDRTSGTINECLFDVVSVNKTATHCFRIGAGLDRTFTH